MTLEEIANESIQTEVNPVTKQWQINLWSEEGGAEMSVCVEGIAIDTAAMVMREWLVSVIQKGMRQKNPPPPETP